MTVPRRFTPASLAWLAVLTLLELGDVVSSLGFDPHEEGNPLIRWAMIEIGDAWIIPKLGVSLAVGTWCAWRWRLGHRIILIGASALLAAVVFGNIVDRLGAD